MNCLLDNYPKTVTVTTPRDGTGTVAATRTPEDDDDGSAVNILYKSLLVVGGWCLVSDAVSVSLLCQREDEGAQ